MPLMNWNNYEQYSNYNFVMNVKANESGIF